MEKNQIKAVIFDLDGVLTDTAIYHYMGWKMLADKLNIPFNEALNEELKGIDRMTSLNKILARGNIDLSQDDKNLLCDEKNAYYVELIKKITEDDLLPGAKRALIELKNKGYKIGLASVSKNAFSVVESLNIANFFDYIVDARTINRGKPNPEIFIACAEAIGVKCHECIGVEDAVAGIEAIKRANMFAIGIGRRDILIKADIVLESLEDFDIDKLT